MKAVKCLKIIDEIKDPNSGKMVSGICVTIKSQESVGSSGEGDDKINLFSTIDNYYISESALDAGNLPLNWGSELNYRLQISATDKELAGQNDTPMYANQLFYDKLKVSFQELGYKEVEEVYYK